VARLTRQSTGHPNAAHLGSLRWRSGAGYFHVRSQMPSNLFSPPEARLSDAVPVQRKSLFLSFLIGLIVVAALYSLVVLGATALLLSFLSAVSELEAEKEMARLSAFFDVWMDAGSIASGFIGGYLCTRRARRSELGLGFSLAASVAILGAGLGLADFKAAAGVPSMTLVIVSLLFGAFSGARRNRAS
ncbi:hypothetical protein, partial [Niveibacterium umoris]